VGSHGRVGSQRHNYDTEMPNQITGANAGGPRQLPMRTRWAVRVAQFGRLASHSPPALRSPRIRERIHPADYTVISEKVARAFLKQHEPRVPVSLHCHHGVAAHSRSPRAACSAARSLSALALWGRCTLTTKSPGTASTIAQTSRITESWVGACRVE